MYSQAICDRARETINQLVQSELPRGLIEYPVSTIDDYRQRLSDVFDPKGRSLRRLTEDEERFILNERLFGKINYQYFAERYWTISIGAQAIGPMFPLFETQELILQQIGKVEQDRQESGHPDGVVIDVLKDRQVGCSTLASSLIGHRLVTHQHVNGFIASDTPESSANLFDMFERGIDHLPWWMKPEIDERVKNQEMVFGQGSRLLLGASKSTRGADRLARGDSRRKGQMGRGRTFSTVHLSELATFTNPDQIDTALEPGIPVSPQTLWIKESTAQGKGKGNWWYQDWKHAKSGKGRTVPVFIGWYLERSRHWRPLPAGGWSPSQDTLAHARRIEETSPRWTGGIVYHPTREQLYWYETEKAAMLEKDRLEQFLQEHPADDEEAFQFSGKSVFPIGVRERAKGQARPLVGMVKIISRRELGTAV